MASARKTLDVNYMTLRKVRPLDDRNARYPSNYIYAVADDGNAVFVNTLDNLETYGIDISELYNDAVRNPMTSDLDASGFQIYDLQNITLVPQASNPVSGPDASSTVWYNSSNNHLYVGGADLQSGSGGSLPTATFFGQSIFWNGSAYTVTGPSVYLGQNAGVSSTGSGSFRVGIGISAAEINQGGNAVAIGNTAGGENQGTFSVAIGSETGACDQDSYAVAIGANAANDSQGSGSVAIGASAGYCNQDISSVSIGFNAGYSNQGKYCVAIGVNAGISNQAGSAIAIGNQAGLSNQAGSAIAIGSNAGSNSQKISAIAIGVQAGKSNQAGSAIAIGNSAGEDNQGGSAIAIGRDSGATSQKASAIAIGDQAGVVTQNSNAIAIGRQAGNDNQNSNAVAIGYFSGNSNQNSSAISIGTFSGNYLQSSNAIAIGTNAGSITQSTNAIAIGNGSGQNNQGSNAIAIGQNAGTNNQKNNSIVLNATGSIINGDLSNATYIAPVRDTDTSGDSVLFYNTSTKEIRYDSSIIPLTQLVPSYTDIDISGPSGVQTQIGSTINNVIAGKLYMFSIIFTTNGTPNNSCYIMCVNTPNEIDFYSNGVWSTTISEFTNANSYSVTFGFVPQYNGVIRLTFNTDTPPTGTIRLEIDSAYYWQQI